VSFDLAALTERLTRAGQPAAVLNGTPDASSAQVGAGSAAPAVPNGPDADPARRVSGRGPKRRRWTMPNSPAERTAEPVNQPPTLYRCPHCGERHQPISMGGGGLAAAYSRSVLPDPTRPEPLGRGDADTASLRRDDFHRGERTRSPCPRRARRPCASAPRIFGRASNDQHQGGSSMTAHQHDGLERAEREAEVDQAAAEAVRLVDLSYLADGRHRDVRQRALQVRAERLARVWTRKGKRLR
jgi:hypothetical protein